MTILRVIFSNQDPLLAYHKLKTEIPFNTFLEFVEYLDVYESLKEHQDKEMREQMKAAKK